MKLITNIFSLLQHLFNVILFILLPLFVLILPILLSVWVGNALWMFGLFISWLPAFWVFVLVKGVYELIES